LKFEEAVGHIITFESFGVRVSLQSKNEDFLRQTFEIAVKCLLGKLSVLDNVDEDLGYVFRVEKDENGFMELFENEERTNYGDIESSFFRYFDAMLRVNIAARAKDRVFVHAGVVGWKGMAVVIPASSHTGKTTLVAALLGMGARYFSDEYAIIDQEGMIHPFARPLSIRNWDEMHNVSEVPFEHFGGKVAERSAPVGAVLLTRYEVEKVWNPRVLTLGKGILETLPTAIPLTVDTTLSMRLLNKAFERAIIVESPRGDVKETAKAIIEFLDKHIN